MTQTGMTETAVANVEMAAAWDGEEGDEWTENAERYDATDRWIGGRFEALADIAQGDNVLDVGCGTGKVMRAAARRASPGSVLGIDLSSRMLDYARRQSEDEGLTNVRFVQGDAQVHPFEPACFDIAISSFGAMFFADPVAAFINIGRGLRSSGRIAFLAWQRFEDNEWLTEIFGAVAAGRPVPTPQPGSPGPFGLAEPDAVAHILRDAGFTDEIITPVTEPIWQGADEEDAWSFLSTMGIVRGLTEDLAPAARRQAFANLRRAIAVHATDDGVVFDSAAWFITARKP
jgi:SAM-dependent methyltransferase